MQRRLGLVQYSTIENKPTSAEVCCPNCGVEVKDAAGLERHGDRGCSKGHGGIDKRAHDAITKALYRAADGIAMDVQKEPRDYPGHWVDINIFPSESFKKPLFIPADVAIVNPIANSRAAATVMMRSGPRNRRRSTNMSGTAKLWVESSCHLS